MNSAHEYQNSAKLTGLIAGHAYCYAVFSSKTSTATDLLASTPEQRITSVQSPTTLETPGI